MKCQLEIISREEVAQAMEKMLKESIKAESGNLKDLKGLPKAKTEGIIAGAQEGLYTLNRIKEGADIEAVRLSFDSKIRSSIYHLFEAEYKYELHKYDRYKCQIAYYDNLTTTLQLLRNHLPM